MNSRKLRVLGRTKTLRLEPSFWDALKEYCWREDIGLEEACVLAQKKWGVHGKHLSFSVRLLLVDYFREAAHATPTEKQQRKAS